MKQKSFIHGSLIVFAVLASCAKPGDHRIINYLTRTETGVIIGIDHRVVEAKLIRVEVIANDIMRVTATANDSFSMEKSLMDENTNDNYEKGDFSTIALNYDDATRTVSVGKRQGQYPGLQRKRLIELFWVKDYHGGGRHVQPHQVVEYDGNQIQIAINLDSPPPNPRSSNKSN